MKQYMKYFMMAAVSAAITTTASAQGTNRSAYFLEGATYRHELNPAFIGERGYFSFPGLGNLSLGVRTSASISQFLFKNPNGNGLTTFMNGAISRDEFLDGLPNKFKFGVDLNETLFSFGFNAWGGYNTFGLSLRSYSSISMPSELFRFMKDPGEDVYDLKATNTNTINYMELALGHAHEINEHLTIGAKAKFLLGLGYANMKFDKFDISASGDDWVIYPEAEMSIATPGNSIKVPTKGETGNYSKEDYVLDPETGERTDVLKDGVNDQISYDDIDFTTDNIAPAGYGIAFDLGAEYKLNEDWAFSASLIDLGFIKWSNVTEGVMNESFIYDGFEEIPLDGSDKNSLENQVDQMVDDLTELTKFKRTKNNTSNTTMLAATLNLAAQYTLPVYDRLKFGVLSTTRIQGHNSWSEGRISANISPVSAFEMSLNYALSNFGSTGGFMMNFHPKGFNFFFAADVPLTKYEPAYFVPINRCGLNLNLGINFTFGKKYKPKYKCVVVDQL